jgi:hypothetical protein
LNVLGWILIRLPFLPHLIHCLPGVLRGFAIGLLIMRERELQESVSAIQSEVERQDRIANPSKYLPGAS